MFPRTSGPQSPCPHPFARRCGSDRVSCRSCGGTHYLPAILSPTRRQVNAKGLLQFGPRTDCPKTLCQISLVATPNQLILGDRRSENQAAQKRMFLEQHRTLLLLQRHDQVNLCGVAGSQNKEGDRLGSPATFFCCRQFPGGWLERTSPRGAEWLVCSPRVCRFRRPGQLCLEQAAYQTEPFAPLQLSRAPRVGSNDLATTRTASSREQTVASAVHGRS